jgi:hypothetical protein
MWQLQLQSHSNHTHCVGTDAAATPMVVPNLACSCRRILFVRCIDTVLTGCQVWQQYLRPPQLDFLSLVVWPSEDPMRAGGHSTTSLQDFATCPTGILQAIHPSVCSNGNVLHAHVW